MRLRNKKTGKIIRFYDGITLNGEDYGSLVELNEEWEDCEEPKEFWYIGQGGVIFSDTNTITQDYADILQAIGNYFETKEEAEKAVEKLKAWKRLRDVGCKFLLDDNLVVRFVKPSVMKIETAEQQKSLSDDYMLLFGGEE